MNATLTFTIPGEQNELSDALNGDAWRGVVVELDNILRSIVKHQNWHLGRKAECTPEMARAAEELRDELHRTVKNAGLDLYEPTFNGNWRAMAGRFTVDTSSPSAKEAVAALEEDMRCLAKDQTFQRAVQDGLDGSNI